MKYIEDWLWEDFDEVSSTNDVAANYLNRYQSNFVITAKAQNSGRGRRGRNWVSLDGNLFMSLCLDIDARHIGILSFIVSLSVLDVIKSYNSELDVKLKWPNDVLLNDKKISGILIEREQEKFIVGIGVNIAKHPQDIELLYEATSLSDSSIKTNRLEFLQRYLKQLNFYLSDFEKNGFDQIKNLWLKYAKNLGKKISVSNENSKIDGIFTGVDENGFLLLAVNGDIHKIYVGDVFYLEG